MADEHLRDYVLERADKDIALSEQARLVVLAAFSGDEDLAEVLSDDATSQAVVDALTTPERPDEVPVGAYLTSITVQGFRGIGTGVTVPLQPGPGLVVIAGRNGSGKSTLAEGLELALTGINSRWVGKSTVWSTAWRNLHAGDPASIRVGIAEQGSGETSIGVDWPTGGDVAVSDMKRWVQRAGQKRESPNVLGWTAALEMYRPMLSYDELGSILEGTPSELYDQLYKLLGLEQLTTAMIRLDLEVKRLKEPSAAAKKARDALRLRLAGHDDPRAATALAALGKPKPDLDAVRPLITQSSAATAPAAWRHAAGLVVPERTEVQQACTAMRSAAAGMVAASLAADVLAVDRVTVLETGLLFHEKHGTQPCPVCFAGTLDDDWAQRARAAMAKEREATQALTVARSANHRARTALLALVQNVPAPPAEDDSLTTAGAARLAYQAFSRQVGDDVAMADQAESTLPELNVAYEALRREASELIVTRDDAWHPFAIELADWLKKAELSATAAPTLKDATAAQKWLQDNAEVLRNERIAPLADRAKEIWAALRQESNVELAEIKLVGQKTSRKVALRAGVDGAETEAFGVMSQGELQALALAIFIPRATSDESPFRFVVLDDPIQAMDPSKIEGFLSVLTELAADRQVIVFTHDDRLPAAIRRANASARVIQVTRSANSVVGIQESSNPAKRALADAVAIAYDESVPDEVKRRAIPHLCRDALEYAAWDVYSMRTLTAGASRADAEAAWEDAKKIRARLTLALGGGDTALDAWLGSWSARRLALKVANKGVHDGFDDYKAAVNATKTAVSDLVNTAR
jgi:ABC-type hemin transport system ATPase subunit